MKRLAFLLVVLAATVAIAVDVTSSFTVTTSTATTVTCTSLASTAGASLTDAIGYTVVVSADQADGGAQTLFASGTSHCCWYAPLSTGPTSTVGPAGRTFRWTDCPSSLDFAVSTSCYTGQRDCPSGDFQPLTGDGRIAYVPSALVVDGGTTVSTSITVRRRRQQ